MAQKDMRQPFFISCNGEGNGKPFTIMTKLDSGERIDLYDVADFATAREVACFMTLTWQTLHYGDPDPAVRTEFKSRYGDRGWSGADFQEFGQRFMDEGMLPDGFAFERTIN